jgi:hypothetical protein
MTLPRDSSISQVSSSGVTARKLCGATPTVPPGNPFTALRRESIAAVDEAPLALLGFRSAKTAVGVKSWQQRQAYSGIGCRRCDPRRQLSWVCEWNAAAVMVQVVKLPHLRETALEHLRIGERCDSLQLVRIDPFDELIHELTPRPEAIALGTAPLREPCNATLKRVAVQIGNARNANLEPFVRV